ncbi:hypothetical protein, conserved [Eimeria maxima]|uniref:Kinesin motor domain-containing protein n=1 Tax=Eimeria maxima TaxID=5804 RepID=U6MF09_EIMMA|nr:hypothetical protein, conserved [Eimeria maxima]CDJ61024.1 hypothetical protein, conserved [Eimeria maxima]
MKVESEGPPSTGVPSQQQAVAAHPSGPPNSSSSNSSSSNNNNGSNYDSSSSSSSSFCSSSFSSRFLNRQVLVGVRFRPPVLSPTVPRRHLLSPSRGPQGGPHQGGHSGGPSGGSSGVPLAEGAPEDAAAVSPTSGVCRASDSADASPGEGTGAPQGAPSGALSSTSSLGTLPGGGASTSSLSSVTGGGPSSTSSLSTLTGGPPPKGPPKVVRRPPWARKGPQDSNWALREEESDGWVLAAPWALDMGGPLNGGAPQVDGAPSVSDNCTHPGGPPRVWDGYKDVCYEADCLLPPGSTNAEVYVHLVKDCVAAALHGYNAAVLAYGQTASGKTHTMFGGGPQGPPTRAPSKVAGGLQKGAPTKGGGPLQGPRKEEEKGVIEMALGDIFKEKETRREGDTFTVSVSMLEVYQETVTDLLQGGPHGGPLGGVGTPGGPPSAAADARPKRAISLCERADGTLDLGSLSSFPVSSLTEALSLVQRGQQQRHAAATAANARSSRSHAVLRIVLTHTAAAAAGTAAAAAAGVSSGVASGEGPPKDSSSTGAPPRGPRRTSVLSLVDLAGSESAGGPKGVTGGPQGVKGAPITQREGGSINRSLLALSRVVKALTQQQKQQQQQQQQQQEQQHDTGVPTGSSMDTDGAPTPVGTHRRAAGSSAAATGATGATGATAGASGAAAPAAAAAAAAAAGPPFLGIRDSKLTRLLSDCLGGPSKTSVICLCLPGVSFYRQTAATLAFAKDASKIPIAQETGGPQGPHGSLHGGPHQGGPHKSKYKRPRKELEPAAAAAAAATAAGAVSGDAGGAAGSCVHDEYTEEGSSTGGPSTSGGPPIGAPHHRQFVYIPTGCQQCRVLYKGLKEAKEEIAYLRVQLRQFKYVVNRGLAAAAAAAPAAAAAAPGAGAPAASTNAPRPGNAAAAAAAAPGGATSLSSNDTTNGSSNCSSICSSSISSSSSSSNSSSTPRRTEPDKLRYVYNQGSGSLGVYGASAAGKENTAAAAAAAAAAPAASAAAVQQQTLNYGLGVCYKPPQTGAPVDTHKGALGGPLSGPHMPQHEQLKKDP